MTEISASTSLAAATAALKIVDELPLPYIELDTSGVVIRANRATQVLHPTEQGELIGRLAWDSMPTNEKEQNCAAYFSLMASGLPTGVEPPMAFRNIYDNSGNFRTYEIHRNLIRDETGRPSGMRMVCVDVTDAHKNLQEARSAHRWLESVIAALSDAILVTDTLGFIRTANPAAEALFGWKSAELIGNLVENVLPILSYNSCDESDLSVAKALSGRCRGTATMLDKENREVQVEIGTSPILDQATGFTDGVVTVYRRLEKSA